MHFNSLLILHFGTWAVRLVLALGAAGKVDLVPGAAEFALLFSTLEDAYVSIDHRETTNKL